MLRVGYRIRLTSGKGPDREGVITALVGSMLRVRWPSQEETIVIPGPGTVTVLASSGDDAPLSGTAWTIGGQESRGEEGRSCRRRLCRRGPRRRRSARAMEGRAEEDRGEEDGGEEGRPDEEGRDWESGVRKKNAADQDSCGGQEVAVRRRERGAEVADLVRVSESANPRTDAEPVADEHIAGSALWKVLLEDLRTVDRVRG